MWSRFAWRPLQILDASYADNNYFPRSELCIEALQENLRKVDYIRTYELVVQLGNSQDFASFWALSPMKAHSVLVTMQQFKSWFRPVLAPTFCFLKSFSVYAVAKLQTQYLYIWWTSSVCMYKHFPPWCNHESPVSLVLMTETKNISYPFKSHYYTSILKQFLFMRPDNLTTAHSLFFNLSITTALPRAKIIWKHSKRVLVKLFKIWAERLLGWWQKINPEWHKTCCVLNNLKNCEHYIPPFCVYYIS